MSLERCITQFQAATTCIKSTFECNECFNPSTFETSFPDELEAVFAESLEVTPPYQPDSCKEADTYLCEYYNSDAMNCCCQEETYDFMQCAVSDIYTEKYAFTVPCDSACEAAFVQPKCITELTRARTCVQQDIKCVECLSPENFLENFPSFVETEFRKALASVSSPTIEGFCEDAHERLCNYHEEDLNCCCQEETLAYIDCTFHEELMAQYGDFDECNSSCKSKPAVVTASASEESSGIGTNVIMGGLLAITALFCCAYIYFKKRGHNKAIVPGQQKQAEQQLNQQQRKQQQQRQQGPHYGAPPGKLLTVHENGSSSGTRLNSSISDIELGIPIGNNHQNHNKKLQRSNSNDSRMSNSLRIDACGQVISSSESLGSRSMGRRYSNDGSISSSSSEESYREWEGMKQKKQKRRRSRSSERQPSSPSRRRAYSDEGGMKSSPMKKRSNSFDSDFYSDDAGGYDESERKKKKSTKYKLNPKRLFKKKSKKGKRSKSAPSMRRSRDGYDDGDDDYDDMYALERSKKRRKHRLNPNRYFKRGRKKNKRSKSVERISDTSPSTTSPTRRAYSDDEGNLKSKKSSKKRRSSISVDSDFPSSFDDSVRSKSKSRDFSRSFDDSVRSKSKSRSERRTSKRDSIKHKMHEEGEFSSRSERKSSKRASIKHGLPEEGEYSSRSERKHSKRDSIKHKFPEEGDFSRSERKSKKRDSVKYKIPEEGEYDKSKSLTKSERRASRREKGERMAPKKSRSGEKLRHAERYD